MSQSHDTRSIPNPLKVAFTPGVSRWNDIIGRAISEIVEYTIDEEQPDLLFVSDTDSSDPRAPHTRSILVAIENSWPDFTTYAGGLTFLDRDHPRNLRLPLYALIARPEELVKTPDFTENTLGEPRKFCAFVASNSNPRRTRRRINFFRTLHQMRHVDSAGGFMNNMGGKRAGDLRTFYRNYRFCITFENQGFPGYTTEKIAYAMRSGCIPIYWGNPEIHRDFNPASFIHARDFPDDQTLAHYVLKVADSPELLRKYLQAPYLPNNQATSWFDHHRVTAFLKNILTQPLPSRNLPYIRHHAHRLYLKALPYIETIGDKFTRSNSTSLSS